MYIGFGQFVVLAFFYIFMSGDGYLHADPCQTPCMALFTYKYHRRGVPIAAIIFFGPAITSYHHHHTHNWVCTCMHN